MLGRISHISQSLLITLLIMPCRWWLLILRWCHAIRWCRCRWFFIDDDVFRFADADAMLLHYFRFLSFHFIIFIFFFAAVFTPLFLFFAVIFFFLHFFLHCWCHYAFLSLFSLFIATHYYCHYFFCWYFHWFSLLRILFDIGD